MDDRAIGKLRSRPVMVGDDHVHAERACGRHFLDRADPAVDGDQQTRSARPEILDRPAREAVAVLRAARQPRPDLGAEVAQRSSE